MSDNDLKVVQGEIVGSNEFEELDRQITEVIRDFVQLGELLIKMRDGQHYRTAGYSSFEDYCKGKAGLSVRHAQEVVRLSIGYKAITENGGAELRAPETQSQLNALLPVASFKTETREFVQSHPTQGEKRQKVEQVVGIKNPKEVAEQWQKTLSEYDRLRNKAEKEGKKPPTLSGKFVRNLLPGRVKVSPDRGFNCNPLVNLQVRLAKLHESINQQGFTDRRKVPVLIKAEPPCLPAQVKFLLDECNAVSQDLNTLMDILEEHINA